ncbi:baseplate J/gp47 family protein [Bradyrhizobium sp. 2S1]|uniref:baseplate J/gp47 family protein n=1 Tax=Bradyrhizobium sp. 2S1 TaxID=1404429 RepID=UPI00140DB2F9|nr:baseplate J/gp47 family protein [Bradyrhizobium sp. 2S1]MCK7665033.1 baseplate J/gp47 family protein [Bradyrhizobium sp. 2S1]
MIDEPAIDGRRYEQLKNELLRRADVLLSNDGRALPVGTVAAALFDAVARIGEEVTRRLDKVPEKQVANFLTEARIGRDPARPAQLPVAFVLAERAADGKAVTGTRLMTGDGEPVIFETAGDITLIGGDITAIRGVDAGKDAITLPPDAFTGLEPKTPPVVRVLKSGASAGATKLQLNPAAGLEAGMILKLGPAAGAPQHRITAVEDDLVTIDPALEQSVPENLAVTTVSGFAPFGPGTRNWQRHVLYLGHETLFDLPSAVSLRISGLALPEATIWEWWGTTGDDEKPAWRRFEPKNVGSVLELRKPKGKTLMREVHGQTKFWLRARLPEESGSLATGADIRVAVAINGLCSDKPGEICKGTTNDEALKVDFEAIANTTPVVPNKGFHPFGREPRLFDTFYVGSAEALSKPDAKVTMCFDLGGPALGPLMAIEDGLKIRVFGIGTDGLIYSTRFEPEVSPRLEILPRPPETSGPIISQVGLAAFLGKDGFVRLAAAGKDGVHLATFAFNDPITVDTVKWQRLAGKEAVGEFTNVAFVPLDGATTFDVLGLDKTKRLLRWPGGAGDATPCKGMTNSLLTAQVKEESANDRAVVVVTEEDHNDKTKEKDRNKEAKEPTHYRFQVRRANAKHYTALLPATGVFVNDLAVWARFTGEEPQLFIAGRNSDTSQRQLRVIGVILSEDSAGTLCPPPDAPEADRKSSKVFLDKSLPDLGGGLPTAFLEPAKPEVPPDLIFATLNPLRIVWIKSDNDFEWKQALDPLSIGFSTNMYRQFIELGRLTFVQREDFGISYRESVGSLDIIEVRGTPSYTAASDNIPTETKYVVFKDADSGNAFTFGHSTDGRVLLLPFARPDSPAPVARNGEAGLYAVDQDHSGKATTVSKRVIKLESSPPEVESILIALNQIEDQGKSIAAGVWELIPADGEGRWKHKSINLPTAPAGGSLTYNLLKGPTLKTIDVREVLLLAQPHVLDGKLPPPLVSDADPSFFVRTVKDFGNKRAIEFRHDLLVNFNTARLRHALGNWQHVGPDQPDNPTLSWEYWNGRAWWALDKLVDGTAHLLLSNGLHFIVPPDIAATEVGGKVNYWIRARLIGGEYGQARVKVKTTSNGNQSVQEIDRDISAIRAPYVARFRIGYCAPNFVLPEVILTKDSLGTRDQTSANVEGQRVEIFTPIADLMNSHAGSSGDNADDTRCCDPCATDKAAAPVAQKASASGEPFTRGLLIGLARLPQAERVTLYADVVPNGEVRELEAEVLHKGVFKSLQADDNTYGFSEPGIISFPVPFAVDQVDVMGQPACWLRFRPKSGGAQWSPNLRGLYLNAALARSVETREIAGLGVSSGIPGQELTLAQPPIEVKSLDLRVRERPSDAEREALQRDGGADVILETIGEMPGPWVRWREVDDLGAWESTDRAYMLDTETGTVRFGDGVRGMIPPLGADILARSYRRVIGTRANGTQAGAELQLISPIAGVDKVVALDRAAGGADVETNELARKRQPAKLRHGNRVHTLADIEDFALASGQDVAQARASSWRGGVRLIVALSGANPVPYPARIRALTRQLTEAAGYGLSRPGGLTVIGPRLLKLLINITLIPDDPDQSVSLAQKIRDGLVAFFDLASGGFNGAGWPLGRLPTPEDIAGALATVADKAVIETVELYKEDGEPIPDVVAPNVLVQLGEVTFDFQKADEVAA